MSFMSFCGARKRSAGILALLLLLLAIPGSALGIVISEVCADNISLYRNATGDRPDYIELYNPEETAVKLTDYWLSNDEDEPYMFSLASYTVRGGGYLLLDADKRMLPFKLPAMGSELFLTNQATGETTALTVPQLPYNKTYSLQPSGAYHVADGTPGKENAAGTPYKTPVYVATPEFSAQSGFYDSAFELQLTGAGDSTIYYSTDGSEPDESSLVYSGAIRIDDRSASKNVYSALTNITTTTVTRPNILVPKVAVIRAVAVDGKGNRSRVVTSTFIVGLSDEAWLQNIAVLSIVTDPYDMFDENDGLYMLGSRYADWLANREAEAAAAGVTVDALPAAAHYQISANFNLRGKLHEILAGVQWFDADGVLRFSQDLGLRISGNISRLMAKKSFRLYARKEYGSGTIPYSFWEGIDQVDQIVVRNGGEQTTMFRDAFAHSLLEPLGVPVVQATPCQVFIDGEYWGLYNIRQRQDAAYIAENCDVDEDEVILIRKGAAAEGYSDEAQLFTDFNTTLGELDCSDPADYARACELMDVDNFVAYMAGELYAECVDWINNGTNISLWRTRNVGTTDNADTRWRWIYQDLDMTSGAADMDPTLVQSMLYDKVFATLWPSKEFQQKFLTAVMDVANIVCSQARVSEVLDDYAARYAPYVQMNYDRQNLAKDLESFNNVVESIRTFYQQRPARIVTQLTDALRLSNTTHALTITSAGKPLPEILMNGYAISLSSLKWTGTYFSDCPLTLTAEELIGYDFVGWQENNTIVSTDRVFTLTLEADRTLTPVYAEAQYLALLNGTHAPKLLEDGSAVLSARESNDTVKLLADDGLLLAVDENGGAQVTPTAKWSKRQGVVLALDTAGYEDLTLTLAVRAQEGVPEKWRLCYSLDGESYTEVKDGELAIEEEGCTLHFSLDAALADHQSVFLRLETEKKQFTSGTPALTITALCVDGTKIDTTLASYYVCAAACAEHMGEDFTPPDAAALAAMSQSELNMLVGDLYTELASYLVRGGTRTVTAEDIAEIPALEGLAGQARAEISAQACVYSSALYVDVPVSGAVYVYALAEGALTYQETAQSEGGRVLLGAGAGTYILLDKPLEDFRYAVHFSQEALTEAQLETCFGGRLSDSYCWMEVELLTAYQEGIRFSLPEDGALAAEELYLYSVDGTEMREAACVQADDDGSFGAALAAGNYLLLQRSLDDYQWEAQYAAAFAKQQLAAAASTEGTGKSGGLDKRILIAAAVALVLLACGAAVCVRRKHRKR